jgi:hypothetical protein
MGEMRGAQSLTSSGCEKLSEVKGRYLGIDVAELVAEAKRCLREDCGEFPTIGIGDTKFERPPLYRANSPE